MIFQKCKLPSIVLACSLLISQLELNVFGQNVKTGTSLTTLASAAPRVQAPTGSVRNAAPPTSQQPEKPKKRGWVKWVVIGAAAGAGAAAIAFHDRSPVITVQALTIVPQ